MNLDANLLLQIANSLVTMSCGAIILYLVSKEKLASHLFYYGWSIGFILYGTQILLRALSSNSLLAFIPMLFSFIIFPISTWSLSRRKEVILSFLPISFLYLSLAILFFLDIIRVPSGLSNPLPWILASLFFYLPLTSIIIIHRRLFGNCVDKLIIGWLLLFLANVLLPIRGWVLDALAIFSKIIILAGIMDYDFAIVTQKVRNELSPHVLPATAGYVEEGGLTLVTFRTEAETPLIAISKWVKSAVEENIRRNVETSIMVLQNVIHYNTLRSVAWSKPELVHILVFSKNPTDLKEFTTLRYGITELGATITEIAKKHVGSDSKGVIILVDLSILIHRLGAREVYSFLLEKMGILRSSGTSLIALFHPTTHEERVVALFKTIADKIIQV